jgi:hypothetical protein
MGPSDKGYKYLLLIKDYLSSYLWLIPCFSADTVSTMDAFMMWFAAFGVAMLWVSDRESHFKNQVMDGVRKALRSQHHFTTAYSPWANGTVERACREVLRETRALLSEFQLNSKQCPEVARIVQSVLNNSPSPQRGNIAPITAFTGRAPDFPLRSLVTPDKNVTLTLDDFQAPQLLQIQELRLAFDEIHKRSKTFADSNRASARQQKNQSPAVAANFEVGDFVLVDKRELRGGKRLGLKWNGPQRIVATRSDHAYEVEDITTSVVTHVHSTRLRFYHDSFL